MRHGDAPDPSPLFERCSICGGTGRFRGGVTARSGPQDLGRVAALAERGLCPGCRGTGFVETGLTVGQVDQITASLGRLQELVGPCPRAALVERVRGLQDLARRATDRAEAADDALRCLAEIGELVGFGQAGWGADDRRRLVREVRDAMALRGEGVAP